jgi:hypothetical protein
MCRDLTIRLLRCVTVSLAIATTLGASGCALLRENEPAEPRASDSMGEGLRGIPNAGPTDSASTEKRPFWDRFRDRRVQQINSNLNVDEPSGW